MQGGETRWRGKDLSGRASPGGDDRPKVQKKNNEKITDIYQVVIMFQAQILVLYMNYL